MRPGPPELDGGISRFEMTKTWRGDLQGTGGGVMLSAGDPHVGAAGYVAIETVDGRLDGVQGSFALLQFGSMANGSQTLQYQVAPGSALDILPDSRASWFWRSTRVAPTIISSSSTCNSRLGSLPGSTRGRR